MIPVARPSIIGSDIALVVGTLTENRLTQGPMVERFEAALARWLGARFCVATSSGTTALHLALAAARIGRGHRVLVPDLTYVATANAVRYTGAEVVLADVDPLTWCISEESIDRVRPRPSAVIPVHLYGQAAHIPGGGVMVIEDAAQALGSITELGPLGTLGLAGCFSFYGNKIITTGEGGAITTNDEQLARRLRFLRGQAMSEARFMHTAVGFNYRLTDFAAALGVGQLSRLGQMLIERRRIMATYKERLDGLVVVQPGCPSPNAPWLFSCLVPERDGLMERLRQYGVETRPVFVPLHRMPMYTGQGQLFTSSSAIADSGISLPTFCGLPMGDVHMISDIVAAWCLERRRA